jgi:RNA polymerase sigma-70 factor, ECF subfamily
MSASKHEAQGPSADRWRRVDAALHRFFRGRLADADAREDLVQDVLLRMHERRDQLRDEERLDAWAYRIARNALVDHYRRHRSDPLESIAESELHAPEPDPQPASAEVLGAWLRVRIAELPEVYRAALELTELRGLSQREAAEALGLPYSTLKSRVQRGRDLLHAELTSCCAVELDARGRVTDYEPRTPCACSPTPKQTPKQTA